MHAACGMLTHRIHLDPPISTGYALPEVSFASKCRCHHKLQHGRTCIELENWLRLLKSCNNGGPGFVGFVLESQNLLPCFSVCMSLKVVHHKTIEMTRHIQARH